MTNYIAFKSPTKKFETSLIRVTKASQKCEAFLLLESQVDKALMNTSLLLGESRDRLDFAKLPEVKQFIGSQISRKRIRVKLLYSNNLIEFYLKFSSNSRS